MEECSSQVRQQWEQPPLVGSHETIPLLRRRGAIIDALSVKNDIQLLQSGLQFIDIVLDAPGLAEIERRCHFSNGEILKDVLTSVADDYSVELSKCQIVLLSQPDVMPDLDCPVADYAKQSLLIISPSRHLSVSLRPEVQEYPTRFSSVDECIAHFSCHGLKPVDGSTCENTSSPKLTSLGFNSWEEILDQETIEDLTEKEEDQQEAIWELIYTEHSHLTQLAVVINVFMRCLEYMQSIDLLTEVNYHNIFGHMRDLYETHQKFWNTTLLPCLQKAADDCRPLDVNDLVTHFPEQFSQLFEPYENHCIFEVQNLQALDDAMNNAEFNAYIKWCEGQPECKRLRLKDFLAKPMQRLTKYPLLLKAILRKTSSYESRLKLENIISTVTDFVSKINSALRYQDEVEKVKVVSHRLTTSAVRDVPSGWEKYLQPYLQLDLLAPMPGVHLHQPRTLIIEGALRYKEDTIKLDTYVFLFTDMLLITRPSKKSPDQLVIVKAPYKIDSLIVKPGKEPVVIDLACLNDLKLVSAIFSLKAASPLMATTWIEAIQQAQQIYYQLRCHHECQPQHQLQPQSPMIWSSMSQPEVHLMHVLSLSESDYSQSTNSFHEQSIEACDFLKCHSRRKSRLSSSLSPPVIPITTIDISTQTDEKDDRVETLSLVPGVSSEGVLGISSEGAPTKQNFLRKISITRSSSYDGPRDTNTQEKASSCDPNCSKRDDTVVDNKSVQKHKRSKSLKLTSNKRNM